MTLWFQPDIDAVAEFLFHITTTQREPKTLLLMNNGPNGKNGELTNICVALFIKTGSELIT